jgi:hypothetical protein
MSTGYRQRVLQWIRLPSTSALERCWSGLRKAGIGRLDPAAGFGATMLTHNSIRFSDLTAELVCRKAGSRSTLHRPRAVSTR